MEVVQLKVLHLLAILGGRRSCGALTKKLGRSLALPTNEFISTLGFRRNLRIAFGIIGVPNEDLVRCEV